ncbi:MAG TPA: hypothetical protein VGJ84_14715 [Polyangiaceae bacterium]|jgi:hypothetical protein
MYFTRTELSRAAAFTVVFLSFAPGCNLGQDADFGSQRDGGAGSTATGGSPAGQGGATAGRGGQPSGGSSSGGAATACPAIAEVSNGVCGHPLSDPCRLQDPDCCQPGTSKPAGDGCNTCSCTPQGDGWGCTLIGCTSYNPCATKACGDTCTLCSPSDPTCLETAVIKFCDQSGACTEQAPNCGSSGSPCTGLGYCDCVTHTGCQAKTEPCFCNCDAQCPGTDPGCACFCGGGQYLGCEPSRTAVDSSTVACARSTGDSCATDADCVATGCGGEMCASKTNMGISTCDCTAPAGVACGCVQNRCTWYR